MGFHFIGEEVCHYICALLSDGRKHSRTEIIEYVRSQMNNDITESQINGHIHSLKAKPVIHNISRGKYIDVNVLSVNPEEKRTVESMKNDAIGVLEDCRAGLYRTCTVNLMREEDEFWPLIEEIKELRNVLYAGIEKLKEWKPHSEPKDE